MINAVSQAINTAIPQQVPEELKSYLEKDVFVFSGLKTHAQLAEAHQYLKDTNGNIVPYYQFEKKVTALNKTYNKNYLEAEYLFAQQSAQSAANWADHSDDTSRYLLQYRTAADDHVRASHQPLHNITLPKTDPFWRYYYAPNGWRCRCHVVEVLAGDHPASDPAKALAEGEKATTQIGKTGVNKLAMFRFNPGIEQKVFPPKNSYTKVVGAERAQKAIDTLAKQEQDPEFTPKNLTEYENKTGVKVKREFFKPFTKTIPLKLADKKKGARIEAYHFNGEVYMEVGDRQRSSKWFAESLVYHEFGHALDWQKGIKKDPRVLNMMAKHRGIFEAGRNELYKKHHTSLDNIYAEAQKKGDYDTIEKAGAAADTIASLSKRTKARNFGWGHTQRYFNNPGKPEAEFIAHMFENKWIGNEVFKKVMPELYDDMINLHDELSKPINEAPK